MKHACPEVTAATMHCVPIQDVQTQSTCGVLIVAQRPPSAANAWRWRCLDADARISETPAENE